MISMTAEDGRQAIREIMGRWDAAVAWFISRGCSQAQAEECAGRYFDRLFKLDGQPTKP